MREKHDKLLIILIALTVLPLTGCKLPFIGDNGILKRNEEKTNINESSLSSKEKNEISTSTEEYNSNVDNIENQKDNNEDTFDSGTEEKIGVKNELTFDIIKGINKKELLKDVKSKYTIVTLATTTCSHCKNFKPTAKKYAKSHSYKYYWIEIDEITDEEYSKLMSSLDDFMGTPHTMVFKNGKFIGSTIGNMSEEVLSNEISAIIG